MMQIRPKFFAAFTSFLFFGILVEHGARVYYGFDIYYAGVHVPVWFSGLVSVLAILFMFAAFQQMKAKTK